MDYVIRSGEVNDSEGILDTIISAFGIQPDSPHMAYNRSLAFASPQQFRVMVSDGQIVACVHIGDTWIQVGSCEVLKGDVGHVSVRRNLQGQGLGTVLMEDTMAWMASQGYHLARLGGLMKFYSRFGFEPFLRRFTYFRVEDLQGGARRIPAAEAYPEPSGYPGELRLFDEARDWQVRAELQRKLYGGRSGAERVAPPSAPTNPAPPDPGLLRFVYERDGVPCGYLFAEPAPLEQKPGETCFYLSEFAYDPGCPQAASLLVALLMARVAERAPVRIISRLPYDESLADALQAGGISFERVEMVQAVAGNMIRVVNLPATLTAVAAELGRRLADSPVPDWRGAVRLVLPAEEAVLKRGVNGVEVHETGGGDFTVQMSQAEFVKALLGIAGFEELGCARLASLDRKTRAALAAMFPRCPTGCGPWG